LSALLVAIGAARVARVVTSAASVVSVRFFAIATAASVGNAGFVAFGSNSVTIHSSINLLISLARSRHSIGSEPLASV
jgi:hypothetical protein